MACGAVEQAIDQACSGSCRRSVSSVVSFLSQQLTCSGGSASRALVAVFPQHALAHLRHRSVGIQRKSLEHHARACSEHFGPLPVGDFYRYRRGGEPMAGKRPDPHAADRGEHRGLSDLQAVREAASKLPPVTLRDLMDSAAPDAGLDRRGRIDHRVRSASLRRACPSARVAGGPWHARRRGEPDRRQWIPAKAAKIRRAIGRGPMATMRARRSADGVRATSA